MSIFIKPGVLKVRDDNDEFSGINIMAEESSQNYLAAIQNKGEEVMDAIEEKGEDTIDSIPSDYTALTNEVEGLREDLSQAVGGFSAVTKSPTDVSPYAGYWSRDSKGTLVLSTSTTHYTLEHPIDISELSVGTKVKVLASVTSNYGAYIADERYNVLDYVNGNNAESKGYTTSVTPQPVTMTVPKHAKYIVSDIRTVKYTGMTDFSAFGISKTNIERNADAVEYVDKYTDVISKNLNKGYTYIYPDLELGLITVTTDAVNPWTYSDSDQYVRTKQGYTIHLFKGDVVGLTDYSSGKLFFLGFQRKSGYNDRALALSSDYTVRYEGDYVIGIYQSPLVKYTDAYTLGKLLFIKRAVIREKQYKRLDKYPLKGCGHRGYFYEGAPENTIWSFRAAKTKGFHYVETDVAWTSDNVAVLLHDPTINRTGRNADGTEISTEININDITYAQALEYDFGIWKGNQYAGTKIMTVEELLIFCRANDMFPYFELKSGVGFSEENITAVINNVKKYDMLDSVAFISFSHPNLITVTNVNQTIKVGRVYSNGEFDDSIKGELLTLKTPYNTVLFDAYLSIIEADESAIIQFCKANDIILGIAMSNDADVMAQADDYITECCSEQYVFEQVISNREMGIT